MNNIPSIQDMLAASREEAARLRESIRLFKLDMKENALMEKEQKKAERQALKEAKSAEKAAAKEEKDKLKYQAKLEKAKEKDLQKGEIALMKVEDKVKKTRTKTTRTPKQLEKKRIKLFYLSLKAASLLFRTKTKKISLTV